MRFMLLISLIAATAQVVSAQKMFPRSPGFAGRQAFPPSFVGSAGRGGYFRHNRGYPGVAYYPFGYFDSLYPDDLYTGEPAVVQPSVIVVQPPPAAAPFPVASPSPAQPLMIELQGDRYVQVSGDQASEAQMIDQAPIVRNRTNIHSGAMDRTPTPRAASVVLVYRDGHQEEVSDYTIADGILYAAADYYTAGLWNRKIQLSSLNLPETIASNQSHGVIFHLPSAPNEVMVGP